MEYGQEIIHHLLQLYEPLSRQFYRVLLYPFVPLERIFLLYLLTSTLFALAIYKRAKPAGAVQQTSTSFFRFLFPAEVWRSASAWLDVRYFFFHQMLRLIIYGVFMSGITAAVMQMTAEGLSWVWASAWVIPSDYHLLMEIIYIFLSIVLVDFTAYVMHYYQHKVPVLWEFHKVHHAPKVMHPLTNYREHPVDNILYAIGTGAIVGLLAGMFSSILGHVPAIPTLLGLNFAVLAFNLLGYNLRHSHIWLRWPGWLAYIFGCPAHHQVHHSCHPDHIDKNFAFIFPVWDVVLGTFCLPQNNKDVVFGLGPDQEDVYKSCLTIYFLPFAKVGRYVGDRWQRKLAP